MNGQNGDQEQLLEELNRLRRRVTELESIETERRAIEESLRKSEERFRALIESSFDSTIILDAQGNITYLSPNIVNLWGRDAGELLGRDMYKYIHPDDIHAIGDNFVLLLKNPGEPRQMYVRAQHVDGTWRTLEAIAHNQFTNPAVGGIVVNFRDVTERKKAEEALQESEERHRLIVETQKEMICRFLPDTTLTFVNDAYCRTFQRSREKLLGRKFLDLIPAKAHKTLLDSMRELSPAAPSLTHEHQVLLGGGNIGWNEWTNYAFFDEDGEVKELLAIGRDVTERKKAEEDLCKSEAKYRELFDNAQVGIYRSKIDGSAFLEVNNKLAEILGFQLDELIGAPVNIRWTNQGDRDRMIKLLQDQGGELSDYEIQVLTKNGDVKDVVISVKLYAEEGWLEGTMADITERKRAEEAIKIYRDSIETAFDGIIMTDLKGNVTYANASACKILGYLPEDAIRQNIKSFVSDPLSADRIMEQVVQTGKWRGDITAVSKNRKKFPVVLSVSLIVNDKGMPTAMLCIFRDVTESKKAEEELQRKEHYFRSLIENSSDGIMVLNRDGTIRYESQSNLRLLGYTAGERLGKSVFEPIHPDDVPVVMRAFEGVIGGGTERAEIRARHKDGSWHFIEATASNFLDDQAVGGIVVNMRDITERRRMQKDLGEVKGWLEQIIGLSKTNIDVIDGEFNLRYVDPEWQKVYGDPAGRKCYEYFMGRTEVCHDCAVPDAFRTRKERVAEHVLPHENNRIVEVHTIPFQSADGEWLVSELNVDITERKKAESALLEASEEWQATFDATSDAICLLDLGQRILRCNRAMAEMFNVTDKEIIGKHCWEIVHGTTEPIDGCPITQIKNSLRREEMDMQRGGRWFNVAADPILDENGAIKGIVHVVRDITASKKAEEMIQRQERYFRSLIENSSDGVMVLDRDGTMLYESPSCARLLGYSEEERIGKVDFEPIHPDDIQVAVDGLKRMASDIVEHSEVRARHRDGSWHFFEIHAANFLDDPAVGGIVVNLRDITERKQAEEAQRRGEEKYRVLTERMNDIVWIMGLDFRATYASPSIFNVLGFTPEERAGVKLQDIVTPRSYEHIMNVFTAEMERDGKEGVDPDRTVTIEAEYYHKNGSTVWLEHRVSADRDEQGKITGLFAVSRDITERRRAEELIKLQRDLAQRLSAVSNLAEGLDICLDVAISVSGMDSGGVYILDENTGTLSLAHHKGLSQPFVEKASFYSGDHPSTKLIMQGRPVYAVYEELRVPMDDIRKREGIKAIAIIPFSHEGRVIGCVNIASHTMKEVSPYARYALEIISSQIGGAIARMQTRQKLRESEEKYSILVESSTDGVSIIQDQSLKFVNKRMSEMSGYSVEELTGMSTFDLVPPDFIPVLQERFRLRAEDKEVPDIFETRMLCKDGTVKEMESSTRLVQYEGRPAVIAVTRDVTERRLAEKALRESEEKYSTLVENAIECVTINRDEDKRIVYANKRMAEVSGYSIEELLGMTIIDLIPPDFFPVLRERFRLRKEGKEIPDLLETRLLCKDGTIKELETSTRLIEYQGRPAVMSVTRDVTERRRMENALRESEEKYRMLAENASDVIMLMDMNAKPVYFSPSVTRLLGYSVEEALDGSMNDRMTPASMEKAVKHFMVGLDREKRDPGGSRGQTLELEMIHKNGSIVIVEMMVSFIRGESGKPSGMMAILRDITERRKAQEEITRLSNAFMASLDPILIFDMQGTVVSANDAANKLFERDEPGVNALEAVVPEDRERVAAVLQDLIVNGRPAVVQCSIVTRSGRRVPIEASGNIMLDANGKPAGIVVVERDLTERRQAESRQKLAAEILGILNESIALPDAINRILAAIKRETGFYAVGIRLRSGDDFPYFVQSGFSEDFLLTENTLVARDKHGDVCRDKDGKVNLECTCGLVLSGKTDPSNPLFTPGGSAWTNDSPTLLDVPLEQDPRLHPRNRCIHAGFQSVALMPIRSGNEIVGLLQLNDRRKGCFTIEMIRFFEGIAASIGVALMRKQAEDALRESERKIRSIFKLSPDVIMSVDREGKILLINKSTTRIVEETIGTSVYDYIPSEYQSLFARTIENVFITGKPDRIETKGLGPGKRMHWYEVRFAPLQTGDETQSLIVVATDITERKQAEAALKESEARFRTAFDSANTGMYLVALNGNMIKVNNKMSEILGYGVEELERMTVNSITHPGDRDVSPRFMEKALGGEIKGSTYEKRFLTKEGSTVWGLVSSALVHDAEGDPLYFISQLQDITLRKKVEEALRESEERLRVTLEVTQIGVWEWNVKDDIWYASPTYYTMLGYEPVIGPSDRKVWLKRGHPDDVEMVTNKIKDVLNGVRDSYSYEARIRHADGSFRWNRVIGHTIEADAEGKPIRLAGVRVDITERKQAEEALRESEEKYKDLFEHTLLGMEVVDGETGKILLANHSMARMFEFKSPEEMVGIDAIREHILPEDMDWVLDQFAQSMADPDRKEVATIRAKTVNGRLIWVTGSTTSFEYEGRPAALLSLIDVTAAKEAEEMLIRINKAVEGSSDAIGMSNPQGHHFYHNRAFTELFEYTPEELEAAGGGTAIYANKHVARKVFDTIMGGGSWSGEVEMVSKGGRGFTVFLRADAIKDENGKVIGLVGVHTDITERKKAEEKLRETRDYMENLIEHANVPMVVWAPNFRITRFNRAFERLTGMKAKSVIGKDLEILFPKGSRDRSMSFIRTAMRGARWEVVEIPIANVDGDIRTVLWNISPIWAEDGKTPIAIIAQGQDITERKKAEEALRDSEELSRSMLDNAAMGIYLLQNKRFIYVNPTFEKIVGYSSEELVGQEAMNYVHPEDRDMVRTKAVENIKGLSLQPYEFRALRKDGRQIWVMERVTPVRYKGKRAVLASFMETTEHKKAEVELERAYEELKTAHERMVQSEKLRAMGEMASGIAHDFNNMLAVILGRTQLVIDDVKDDKVKKGIQIIEQAALDAAKTVKRLQDFARIRVEHPFELLDVNEVIEGVVKMVETRRVELEQTKGIAIKIEEELGKVGKVSGDAAELREALLNILFNALDAMPTGGKLTVMSEQDEDWVQITIKDTGVGIPDKVKTKIFQPFFTTKASKGSGLGLSVTYGIISRHSGMIKFDSEVGRGTTFYIRLPIAVEEARKQARKKKSPAAKPANILIVDDESEVLKALGLTLEYFGHWVKDFTSGAEAIKAFKEGNYDLVITDLGMPEMSGWDVARAIKNIKPAVPVLLITGWVIDLGDEEKQLVDGVIAKPFSRDSISSAIANVFPAKKKRVAEKPAARKSAGKKKSSVKKKTK